MKYNDNKGLEYKLKGYDDRDWVDHTDKRAHKTKKCMTCFLDELKKAKKECY